jgi:hypothetical protein
MAGAACTLLRLQPAVANSSAAVSPSSPYRKFEVVLTVIFMAILNLENLKGFLIYAEVAKR